MTTRFRISFLLYILFIILAFSAGMVYLAVPTVMPYHHQAIGVSWESLGEGVRALLWVVLKVIGGLSVTLAGVMVALAYPTVNYVPLDEVAGRMKLVPMDSDTVLTGRDLGISFGD